ncbi:MAG: hypothetical protein COA42_18890 [Alteromonadaceae bacterium]|nr:MAG: hypothetical protein COA42_18890 [Alteromonadaceae bacterium]
MKFVIFILFFLSGLSMNTNGKEEKTIEVSKVNIHNYEQFVEQFEAKLPIGTPMADVRKHLKDLDIEYGEAHSEAAFYIMIKKIHSRFFIFTTDLAIRVYFSDDHVSEIKSRLVRTGL